MDPKDLVPNLPKPSELKPFPQKLNQIYEGHQSRVRSLAVFSTGQFLASSDEDGILIIWEATTARIL